MKELIYWEIYDYWSNKVLAKIVSRYNAKAKYSNKYSDIIKCCKLLESKNIFPQLQQKDKSQKCCFEQMLYANIALLAVSISIPDSGDTEPKSIFL